MSTKPTTPRDLLRHHVTGAIERGEAEPIEELRAFDASKYTTPEAGARALYDHLCAVARATGCPDGEVLLHDPERSRWGCWEVLWESGPYQWAITALGYDEVTLRTAYMTGWGTTLLAEPGYSFSICVHKL